MSERNKVIVIGGPTASGKSALALDIAWSCNGEVVNADSMQVYKDIPILSACPTSEDMAKVPHHLYQIYDADFNGTVVAWLDQAEKVIRDCWRRNKLPVVVGGTGLYLEHLMSGTTPIPETTPETRAELYALCKKIGTRHIHEKLAEIDPQTASRIAPGDTTRVLRSYAIYMQTGISPSQWRQEPMVKRLPEAKFIAIKVNPPKEELDALCRVRFDKMLQQGALAEVVKLAEKNLPDTLPVMKALGVPELMAFLRQECSLEEAVELAKLHTRQYCKRQRTWFINRFPQDFLLNACYRDKNFLINNVKKIL